MPFIFNKLLYLCSKQDKTTRYMIFRTQKLCFYFAAVAIKVNIYYTLKTAMPLVQNSKARKKNILFKYNTNSAISVKVKFKIYKRIILWHFFNVHLEITKLVSCLCIRSFDLKGESYRRAKYSITLNQFCKIYSYFKNDFAWSDSAVIKKLLTRCY